MMILQKKYIKLLGHNNNIIKYHTRTIYAIFFSEIFKSYPPILYISTLSFLSPLFDLRSEYLSSLRFHTFVISADISLSLAPDLNKFLKSFPPDANKHVINLPSVESLALLQAPQKGFVTDEMIPISLS